MRMDEETARKLATANHIEEDRDESRCMFLVSYLFVYAIRCIPIFSFRDGTSASLCVPHAAQINDMSLPYFFFFINL